MEKYLYNHNEVFEIVPATEADMLALAESSVAAAAAATAAAVVAPVSSPVAPPSPGAASPGAAGGAAFSDSTAEAPSNSHRAGFVLAVGDEIQRGIDWRYGDEVGRVG